MTRIFNIVISVVIVSRLVSGFVVPNRRLFRLSTLPAAPVRPQNDESEPCVPCNGDNATATGACDLGEEFKKDLEASYARRNPAEESEVPTQLENAREAILNTTFVRYDTSQMRKYLLNQRSYARSAAFETENIRNPPTVEDLLPEPTRIEDSFYLSLPAAIITFLATSAIFPILAGFLVDYVDLPPEMLDEITSKLVPGISVLYGTFISLTLSILYNRQRSVQDSVAQESSLLSFLLHNLVSLFKKDRNRMVRAGQCTADQVRILLRESRGLEYMTIIYTDPYIKMLSLVEEEENRLIEEHGDFLSKGVSSSTTTTTWGACSLSMQCGNVDTHVHYDVSFRPRHSLFWEPAETR
jgi:hypothetical protein